ncbi:MAG: hypothetical protein Q4D03_06850 [Bacteroidales bacterium]|nr:hypothetical protein [Bacteroidales bacterium]
MKKKNLIFALALLIGGVSAALMMNACDKDTNCYVQVSVVDETSNKPLKNAFVKIDIDSSYVKAEGYTDVAGLFNATFTAPAIFNVNATYEDGYDSVYTRDTYICYRKGSNTVRLKEGDTVYSTVVITKDIYREYRN